MDLGTAGGGLAPPKQPPAAPGPPTAPPQRILLSSPAKLLQCAYFWVELGQTQGIFWYFLAQNFLAGHNKKCNGRCTICSQRWVKPCKHTHPVVMNTPTPQNFQNMQNFCRNLHFSVARGTGGGLAQPKNGNFFCFIYFFGNQGGVGWIIFPNLRGIVVLLWFVIIFYTWWKNLGHFGAFLKKTLVSHNLSLYNTSFQYLRY